MIFVLAYEKPENVCEKFVVLKSKILKNFNDENTFGFLEYVDKTYIGISKQPIFKIENWSAYKRILNDIPTTSNIAEGWYRGFNASLQHAHPNLNSVIKELRTRDYLITESIYQNFLNCEKKVCERSKN
jgi:hypothetical protein